MAQEEQEPEPAVLPEEVLLVELEAGLLVTLLVPAVLVPVVGLEAGLPVVFLTASAGPVVFLTASAVPPAEAVVRPVLVALPTSLAGLPAEVLVPVQVELVAGA